jgi:hypothetical protein
MCCSQSCAILLTPSRDSFGLLIIFRNLADGVEASIFHAFFPLSELCHSLLHSFFSLSLYFLVTAEGLMSSGFLRYGGSISLGEERPAAALFASQSAFSLPGIPICPAVYLSVSVYLHLLL